MSAPAVKPVLPAPSGAQAPRVGSGAPNTTPSGAPPGSATSPQKLSSGPVGMGVSLGSVKPPLPPSANHAVPTAVPLSLVQEHKTQSNALPQPPVALPRTPEKPKDLVVSMPPSAAPKPTSNGMEGSPGKAPLPLVQLPPTLAETKKPEDAVSASALMNHSADSAAPASAAGPNSAPASSVPSSAGVLPLVSAAPVVSTSSTSLPRAHSPAVNTQQSPAKPEPVAASATAAAAAAAATAAAATAAAAVAAATATAASNAPAAAPAVTTAAATPPTLAPPAPATPPKSSPSAPVLAASTNSSSPVKSELSAPVLTASASVVPPPAAAAPPPPPPPPQLPAAAAAAESKPITSSGVGAPAGDSVPVQAPAAPSSGPGPGPAAVVPAMAPEVTLKPAPPAIPEVTKTRIEISKPEFKVATPRVSKRKRETKPLAEAKITPDDPNDDRNKSKRVRTRTQPYQSPLPELQYISKFKNVSPKGVDDKLIVFYKNEFLAVRNAEGSFYVCQAMQNIYKSSTRIRIRWLSQDKKENKETNVYIPDFYDVTEFDCILTNLELKKVDKNKYELPQEERDRTQNILKRALDVEKGVGEKPPVTEEHPDGLDLSLYRDEAQLKKKRSSAKGSKKAKKGKAEEGETETSEESQGEAAAAAAAEESEDDGGSEEKKKASKPPKSKASKKEKAASKAGSKDKDKAKVAVRDKDASSPKKERTSERGREREATKRRAEAPAAASSKSAAAATTAKPPPEKKAKVAATPKAARKADKAEPAVADASVPTRATKSRSAKSAAVAATTATPPSNKTSPVTRTKERERRGVAASGGRKKPGKKA